MGREVAIKTLFAGAEPELAARFREEVAAVATIRHPNVLQVYSAGEAEGRPYLVMEYVAGGTLGQAQAGKPLAPRDAAGLLETIARAVQHCHERGVLHRDLKPGNILLNRPQSPVPSPESQTVVATETGNTELTAADWGLGIAKVADFGLAKRLHEGAGLTKTGDVLGTPAYMAPEQASGVVSQIGPGVDIYALGAILYDLLTGRPPFTSPDPVQTIMMVLSMDPIPPRYLQPRLPRDLDTICLKCLEKTPKKRYATAGELADDLHRFLEGRPIHARPIRSWEKAIKWTKRRPAAAALIAVSVLALTTIVAVGAVYNGRLASANKDLETSNNRLAGELNRSEQMFAHGHQLVRYLLHDHTALIQTLKGSTTALRGLVTELLPYLDHLAAEIQGHDRIPGDITVPELALAYERLAEVQGYPGNVNLGDTAAAETTLQKSLALRRSYLADHADDVRAKIDCARCLEMLADLATVAGHRVAAKSLGQEANGLLDTISATGADARAVLQLRFNIRMGLAELKIADGTRTEGIADLRALLTEVRASDKGPADWQMTWNKAQLLARLAELEMSADNLSAAKRYFEEALKLSTALADADRDDIRFVHELAANILSYGDLLLDEKNFTEANKAYEAGLKLFRRLKAADPNGKSIVRDLTIALEKLGRGLNMSGKPKQAVPLLEEAVEFNRDLRRGADDRRKQIGLRISLTSLGTCYGEIGNVEAQRRCYLEALDLANTEGDPAAIAEVHLMLGLSFQEGNRKAEPAKRLADLTMAVQHYDEALKNYDELAKKTPLLPSQSRLKAITERERSRSKKMADQIKALPPGKTTR